MSTPHILGLDPGFGGFKCAEQHDQGLRTIHLPSVVGVGDTDLGLLSLGSLGRRRRSEQPLQVSWDGVSYLAGPRVEAFCRPLQRLDFQRLADGPEQRTLIYAALGQLLGPGEHAAQLMVGLLVEVLADREGALQLLRNLRRWLVATHRFQLDGQAVTVTVSEVKAIAQPVGAFFAWGLDAHGRWGRGAEDLKAPAGICDIGFNTVDLFAVAEGQVVARFTGGETLGLRRAAEQLAGVLRRQHGVSLSLHEADALLRHPGPRHHAAGQAIDLAGPVRQALDANCGAILAFLDRQWGNGRQFARLLFTGGGSAALQTALLAAYPHGVILPHPVTANAAGLARYGRRVFAAAGRRQQAPADASA